MKITKEQLKQIIKEEFKSIQEDGHSDVPSAVRAMKTIIEDASQMLQVLEEEQVDGPLPTWWTNKMAVAANDMNKMRDYLLVEWMAWPPASNSVNEEDDYYDMLSEGETIEEAEYQGRKVTLNKPFRTPDGPKKSSVYVKNAKGNVVKVNFGDPKMKIKKNIPARRKSFRARHNCDNPGPKWKARYWSCKAW
tara:strand:- start:346 stop:921 length:576 start_codon:yes stop_codon:yes gene_type:complete